MIQIEDEDIVVLTCAGEKSTDITLYRCDEKSDPCFCISSKQGNSCFCLRSEEEVTESLCYCPREDRKEIKFVANPDPDSLPEEERDSYEYVHPDCPINQRHENGKTWRQLLEKYNRDHNSKNNNRVRLLPAYNLYKPRYKRRIYKNGIYDELFNKLGERFYILSAGWGLVKASYRLPSYDITFADKQDENKLEHNERSIHKIDGDMFHDFNQLPSKDDFTGLVHFFGGWNYLELFSKLSHNFDGKRYIWYRRNKPFPEALKEEKKQYYPKGNNRTWHYKCVEEAIL